MKQQAGPSAPKSQGASAVTAAFLCAACMIGTGVFTTSGFMVRDLGSPWIILLCWAVGGVAALCGSLVYAELISAMPRSGGEYHLVSRLYKPSVGFMSAWVSIIAGFAAPCASSSLAFGAYLSASIPGVDPTLAAVALIVALTSIYAFSTKLSHGLQNGFTFFKLALIIGFIAVGFTKLTEPTTLPAISEWRIALSSPFAISLVFVSYAYSGWSTAAYIAGETKDAAKSIPRALIAATLGVTLLYVLLNTVFLFSTPASELSGVVEVAHVVGIRLFGDTGSRWVSLMIAFGLISAVGSLIVAGPRVLQVLGQDYHALSPLSRLRADGTPMLAVLTQSAVALIMVYSASFEILLKYMGVTLIFVSSLTVAGIFKLRRIQKKENKTFKCPWHPLPAIMYIAIATWMLALEFYYDPMVVAGTIVTVALGFGLHFILKRVSK
jgi:APA family basic amino acid/polyamine antiporter